MKGKLRFPTAVVIVSLWSTVSATTVYAQDEMPAAAAQGNLTTWIVVSVLAVALLVGGIVLTRRNE